MTHDSDPLNLRRARTHSIVIALHVIAYKLPTLENCVDRDQTHVSYIAYSIVGLFYTYWLLACGDI